MILEGQELYKEEHFSLLWPWHQSPNLFLEQNAVALGEEPEGNYWRAGGIGIVP